MFDFFALSLADPVTKLAFDPTANAGIDAVNGVATPVDEYCALIIKCQRQFVNFMEQIHQKFKHNQDMTS
jgi:hypothetical protein